VTAPHGGGPISTVGRPLAEARAAVVLVHGRGATARSILTLAGELGHGEVAYLAPQAAGGSWYPMSFLAPLEHNEPGLSSGLAALDAVLAEVERAGIPSERQLLVGFSQGACLTLEYAARNPRRYGGVVGLTGGLIGPHLDRDRYAGSLSGAPVFLGSSDPDPHVPWERVEESAALFERLGAEVTLRRYPGMGHTIHPEELAAARRLLESLAPSGRS
jgi:predicted esterase